MNTPAHKKISSQAEALRNRVKDRPGDGTSWQQLGFALHQLGQHADAVKAFETARACGASARVQAALHALSLSALGRHQDAVAILQPLQAKNPKDFDLANLLGVMHKRAGQLDRALRMLEVARKLNPRSVSAWQNIGNVQELAGNFGAAAQAFGGALRIAPSNAELWRLQSFSLFKLGQLEAARASAAKAVSLAPVDGKAVDLLVTVLLDLHRTEDALEAVRQYATARPGDPEAQVFNARVLFRSGKTAEAKTLLEEVLSHHPGHISANFLLAHICGNADRRAATEAYRRAHNANPDSWLAANKLVDSLYRSRYDDESKHLENAYALACDIQKRHPDKRLDSARQLRTIFTCMMDLDRVAATGSLEELLPHWQKEGVHGSVHYELGQVQSTDDRLQLVKWHREWGRRIAAKVKPVTPLAMPLISTERKLRVGFMSSDLRNHPVGYFALPLLQKYDRDRFEVYCYSFYEGQLDKFQAFIESQVTAFRWWPKRPHAQVAEGIAADGLDILFELGGSTAMNKLEVMAYRPARIGASWLGYPHSAGLEAIDYILVDPFIRPPNPALLIERPFELPETWVTVSDDTFRDIPIAPSLPEERRGHLTFGTANNPYKFIPACIDAWAAVLSRVPNSHFLFLRPEAATSSFVANARAAFAARDVDPARLDFIGIRGAHLPHYNEIDIALDSLPHVGGTTTCEALWMGVPTVSLVGEGFPERLSYSNLSNAGLGDLATFSVSDYVETAAMLAEDRTRRRLLRQDLRTMIRTHPLGQVDRFVQHFYAKVEEVVAS